VILLNPDEVLTLIKSYVSKIKVVDGKLVLPSMNKFTDLLDIDASITVASIPQTLSLKRLLLVL
jgi:hypothetical protein